jgi:hypothetical protein
LFLAIVFEALYANTDCYFLNFREVLVPSHGDSFPWGIIPRLAVFCMPSVPRQNLKRAKTKHDLKQKSVVLFGANQILRPSQWVMVNPELFYAQAITPAKHAAQAAVVSLMFSPELSSSPVSDSAENVT